MFTQSSALPRIPVLNPVAQAVRKQRLLIAVILCYISLARLFAGRFGYVDEFSPHLYTRIDFIFLYLFTGTALLGHILYVMIRVRPERLTGYLLGSWRAFFANTDRILQGMILLILLPLFMSSFTFMKSIIPVLAPYGWDPVLADWDNWLHGGTDPWRLLQPLIGRPALTTVINVAYYFWFFVICGVFYWQAFDLRRPDLRMRYFLSFFLNWILIGTVAATFFSSVGPVYYQRVYGGADRFGDLINYLQEAGSVSTVWALEMHQKLWENYEAGSVGLGSGISAMPSMHLAGIFTVTMLAFQYSRVAGWIALFYTGLIFVGSIHLGWHYALDGYAGILLSWLTWKLTARLSSVH